MVLHNALRDIKRRKAAINALLDRLSTASKWIVLVEKQTNTAIHAFIPTTLCIPLLIIRGPSKFSPVTVNGREYCTLCSGNGAIIELHNLGLARIYFMHRRTTERVITHFSTANTFDELLPITLEDHSVIALGASVQKLID